VRALWCVLLAVCLTPARARAGDLERLLDRAAQYAAGFRQEFSSVIASERYQQVQTAPDRRQRTRQLRSEVFFVTLDDDGSSMTVRSVEQVDGRRVADSRNRVAAALGMAGRESRRALRLLADEGARFNLGSITRNFSDPTLALLFVAAERQPRFRFEQDGRERLGDVWTTRVSFVERQRPTLIHDGRSGASLPASGTLFIGDDGRIWQTEMRVRSTRINATLRVRYDQDARLSMLVPASMDEEYVFDDTDGPTPGVRVVCHADYTNYRRFETAGRIIQ
jgi:hypothetical protein